MTWIALSVILLLSTSSLTMAADEPNSGDAAEKAFDTAMFAAAFRHISSAECLKLFEELEKTYPNGPKFAETRQMIKTLKRNIAEEEQRPKTWLQGVLKLTKKDEVTDSIYSSHGGE